MPEACSGGGKPHTSDENSSAPARRTWATPKLRRIPAGGTAGKAFAHSSESAPYVGPS